MFIITQNNATSDQTLISNILHCTGIAILQCAFFLFSPNVKVLKKLCTFILRRNNKSSYTGTVVVMLKEILRWGYLDILTWVSYIRLREKL